MKLTGDTRRLARVDCGNLYLYHGVPNVDRHPRGPVWLIVETGIGPETVRAWTWGPLGPGPYAIGTSYGTVTA